MTIKMASDYKSLIGIVALTLIAVSLILQIVGFTTPGWVVTTSQGGPSSKSYESSLGLWYYRLCVSDNCTTYTLKEYDDLLTTSSDGLQDDMLEADIETTIALFFCLVAIVAAIVWLRYIFTRRNTKIPLILCTLACTISGVLCLIVAWRYGNDQRTIHNNVNAIYGSSPIEVPYALILTGVGGIMIILAIFPCCIALFVYDRRMERRRKRRSKYHPPPHERQRMDYIPHGTLRPYYSESERSYYSESERSNYSESERPYSPGPKRYSPSETPVLDLVRSSRSWYRPDRLPGGDVVHVKYDPPRVGSHMSSSIYRPYLY